MKVVCTPTSELDEVKINEVLVPMRIWRGQTEKGTRLELLVLSIIPHPEDIDKLANEMPKFMKPSKSVMQIADFPIDKESS
jgi:hypothetical protein